MPHRATTDGNSAQQPGHPHPAGHPPPPSPIRRIVVVTLSMSALALLFLTSGGGGFIVGPDDGHAHAAVAAGKAVRAVPAGNGERVVRPPHDDDDEDAHRDAATQQQRKPATGSTAAATLPAVRTTASGGRRATTLCPQANAWVVAQALIHGAEWSFDRGVVAAAAKRRAAMNATASAAPDQTPQPPATEPPHEASAPVLVIPNAAFRVENLPPTVASAFSARCGAEMLAAGGATATTGAARQAGKRPAAVRDDGAGDVPHPELPRSFHRFDQTDALRCLSGKYVLLYGNSNTRTLYTALEALLRNTAQIGRVMAKQKCDNSKKNHSCAVVVEPPAHLVAGAADGAALQPVRLFYWGYVKDIYHPELQAKMASRVATREHQTSVADYVVANAGINVIQGTPDGQWEKSHEAGLPKLRGFFDQFERPNVQVWWHTTTRVCEHQKHFTKYKYDPKYWSGRSLKAMNAAVSRANDLVLDGLAKEDVSRPSSGAATRHRPVNVLDGARLVDGAERAAAVCPHYDDPLHHRFVDRELVQLLLNAWCPAL